MSSAPYRSRLTRKVAGERRPGELLIRFRHGVSESERDALVASARAQRVRLLRGASGVELLSLAAGRDESAVAEELGRSPLVEFAEPNFTVMADQLAPNDARFGEQWALSNTGARGGPAGADVKAVEAWRHTTGSPETVVAIIDSGVDFAHPDLRRNRWVNARERRDGRDDDRDGFADDAHGWDWVDDSAGAGDANGHGTSVAGIIAAEGGNSEGVAGVMWRASLMSLRVLDGEGRGSVAAAVEAIDYAARHGARVINCSWGLDEASQALRGAIERAGRAGALVVVSAGNGGRDVNYSPRYPSSFRSPYVLAVASSDSTDGLSAWSNWGGDSVALAAPGEELLTTKAGGGYAAVSGTSASAALASGVAGLVKTLRPRLSAERVRGLMVGGARPVAGLHGRVSAGGILDAAAALEAVSSLSPGERANEVDGRSEDAGGEKTKVVRADASGGTHASGGAAGPPPLLNAPAAHLPNLDEVRRHVPGPPRVLPPVPSKRRRCPPHNPRCNEAENASPQPTPPPPSHTPQPRAETEESGVSFVEVAANTPDGPASSAESVWPAVNVPAADFYRGGGRAVSDVSFAPALARLLGPSVTRPLTFLQGSQTPYGGTPRAIPGTIQGEDFDDGGEGIAYHDTTPGNSQNQYRTGGVDIGCCYSVGAAPSGEWLEYTVNVAATGSYTLEARVGSYGPGASFHVEFDGADVSGPVSIPYSGAVSAAMVTKTGLDLTAGEHVVRFVFDVNAGGLNHVCDLDYLKFIAPDSIPYSGTPHALPGTIESELYDQGGQSVAYNDATPGTNGQNYNAPPSYPPPTFRQPTDVDLYQSTNYNNGYLVLSQAGEWMNYTVNVSASGSYNFEARVAWGGFTGTPGTFHIEFDGADVTGPLQIPNTNWAMTTVTKTGVQLTAGRHVMRIVSDANAANGQTGDFDYVRFTATNAAYNGPALAVPGNIEIEHYDSGGQNVGHYDTSPGSHGQNYNAPPSYPPPTFRQPTEVDIYQSVGYSGGYLVMMQAGDWMKYTVDVAALGTYTLEARVYYWGPQTGGTFHVEVDGVDKTGPLTIPGTNRWETLRKTGVQLTAGRHTLRIVADSNSPGDAYAGDIDYLRFVSPSASPGSGLTGRYYDTADFNSYKLTRADAAVNFDWGTGAPHATVGADTFSVRWTGMVVPRFTETYTFYAQSDDGVRLWLDGNLLIDNWTPHAATWNTATVALVAGRQYALRLEYYDNTGGAIARLEWSSASQLRETVPQSQLYGCSKSTEQYVRDFYQGAVGRQPTNDEVREWSERLVQAQGETQLVAEAQALGRALFKSQEYTNRNRTEQQYVEDLYAAYLQRPADAAGLTYWMSVINPDNAAERDEALGGFESGGEFHEKTKFLCGTSAAASDNGGAGYNFSSARLEPSNRTGAGGVDPLSRNQNWTLPLLSLPGRAGLDLGLTLSYNSLVWTKDATGITFDGDRGFPSPGFRLGFPVIQTRFRSIEAGTDAYLLITPSGGRVELRRVGTSNNYESVDSTFLQLTDYGGGSLVLLTTDGTRLTFALAGGAYRCVEVKDGNGNFITVTYDSAGQIRTIVDTLGRTVTFNYDAYQNLISITQPWKREVESGATTAAVNETHTWATFGYRDLTLLPNFTNLAVMGTPPGTVIPAIQRVGLADGSYYKFDYNQWGQVWKITHFAADSVVGGVAQDTHALSYVRYDLPGSDLAAAAPQVDCPRFTEQRTWVENGIMGASAEAATEYTPWTSGMASCEVTAPDGTVQMEFYGTSGRLKGLTTQTEVWSAGQRKKWTTYTWKQPNLNLLYPENPRVEATQVRDVEGNQRLTTVTYTSYNLPEEVVEYKADGVTPLRTTLTHYVTGVEYTGRRVLGLPAVQYLFDGANATANLRAKVEYVYDETGPSGQNEPDFSQGLPSPATQHDAANFGTSFRWRGNLSRVKRYEVNQQNGLQTGATTDTLVGHHVTGAPAFIKDAAGHKSLFTYADAFYQNVNRSSPSLQTYAYPTSITDPDGYSSNAAYNYDTGQMVSSRTPKPNETQSQLGPEIYTLYDAAGRVVRVTNSANAARARLLYPQSMGYIESVRLVDTTKPEIHSPSVLDGAGRVRAASAAHVGSSGASAGRMVFFDAMGRVARAYNPVEIDANWNAVGDDAAVGWKYVSQSYDWQGRPLVMTNTDGTTREAEYGGCGCAGGATVTLSGEAVAEGRRREKIYHDVFGRPVKREVLNWNGSVYSAVVTDYNARDQVRSVKDYKGAADSGGTCPLATCQQTTSDYDKYGRLMTTRRPEQDAPTTYEYFDDDTLKKVTDGRGASALYTYNGRHLPLTTTYAAPSPIPVPSPVTFDYDSAGNLSAMTDEQGTASYGYDALSRLSSETRQFNGVGSYTLSYLYNLAGQLTELTDHAGGKVVKYAYDDAARTNLVTGTGYGTWTTQFVTSAQYRAWGALKAEAYGNTRSVSLSYNARLQLSQFEVAGVMKMAYEYVSAGQSDNDGLVKFMRDLAETDSRFDRRYRYDHAGRLVEALTGADARAGAQVSNNRPFYQTYSYDAWGHLTGRTGKTWSEEAFAFADSYERGQNQSAGWDYDPAGNPTTQAHLAQVFDAAGQVRSVASGARERFPNGVTVSKGYDGLGQRVSHREGTDPYTFYLRSSVLGGAIVAEIKQDATRLRSYVYAGGELLAKHENSQVEWHHRNPVTASQRWTKADGSAASFHRSTEPDPMGTDHGLLDWAAFEGERQLGREFVAPRYGDALNLGNGCMGAGAPEACGGGSLQAILSEGGAFIFRDLGRRSDGDNEWLKNLRRDPTFGLGVGTFYGGSVFAGLEAAYEMGVDIAWIMEGAKFSEEFDGFGWGSGKSPGQACDERLAGIFGDGKNGVFATDHDPETLGNRANKNRLDSPSEDPRRGHAHIFATGNGEGVAQGNLFTPAGFSKEERDYYYRESQTHIPADEFDELQNFHRFTYKPGSLANYGYAGGLIISFVHSGPTDRNGTPAAAQKPAGGRVLVGVIGAYGNPVEVGGAGPGYVHTHIRFYKADRRGRRTGLIDPRSVFCKDLGF